jgi:hypothetical protein
MKKRGMIFCVRLKRASKLAKKEIIYFYSQIKKFNEDHKKWVDKNGHKI